MSEIKQVYCDSDNITKELFSPIIEKTSLKQAIEYILEKETREYKKKHYIITKKKAPFKPKEKKCLETFLDISKNNVNPEDIEYLRKNNKDTKKGLKKALYKIAKKSDIGHRLSKDQNSKFWKYLALQYSISGFSYLAPNDPLTTKIKIGLSIVNLYFCIKNLFVFRNEFGYLSKRIRNVSKKIVFQELNPENELCYFLNK